MYDRERFDTRFPPEAWSDPEALHRKPRSSRLRWFALPVAIVGAGFLFSGPSSSSADTETVQPVALAPLAEGASLDELRDRIASLVIAAQRLDRAAQAHQVLAEETGNQKAAEAAHIIASVRDRYDAEVEAAAEAANLIMSTDRR
ncbi:MAG: hypothetical protein AAFU79_03590 [Myxococcota bacterium]